MVSFFLARRYLSHALTHRATASSLSISLLVLMIGSFALALALSITQAFEEKIFERLKGTNAHAFIYSYGQKVDERSITTFLRNTHSTDVVGITPQSMHSVIVSTQNKQAVITLRGIDPLKEPTVTNLSEKVLSQNYQQQPFEKLFDKNQVLIGHTLAKNLGLAVGSTLTIFVPDPAHQSKRLKLSEYSVIVSGLFNVGIEEFDGSVAFCSLATFNAFFNVAHGVDSVLVALAPQPPIATTSFYDWATSYCNAHNPFGNSYHDSIIKDLKKELPHLTVASWKELYPALLSAMKLEKYAIIGIILLLTLVALMSVIATLFTLVNRKQRDIALFQTLGMPERMIRRIFTILGMFIVTLGCAGGSALALCASYILETWKCIPLPDAYYLAYVPASTNLLIFIGVPLLTMIIGFGVITLSARCVQAIDTLDVLRHTA